MMFSFFSFGGKEPSSPEYHEQLLRLTKQLELKLYQSAPSFEAYLDMFTESGLQHLAVRVATETWPSCAQLVKAALLSRERNELHRKFEHNVAALQKEIDHVNNEKTTVDAQLNEALVELKAKESLLGDMKGTLEQLEILQQQRDTEVKSLKLKYETMIVENTTLAAEKAKAVDEATRAALESKSLLEDGQALNTKYDKLKVETQSMNLKFKAMEKDVVDCFLKDRKIKALEDKIEALTNAANEAVVAKANVVVQLEEATCALLARDSEIEAREQKIDALTNEVDVATAAKLAVVVQLEEAKRTLLAKDSEIEAREQKIGALTNEVDEAVAAKLDVVVQLEEATHALLTRDSEIAAHEQKIGALTSELDKAVTAKLALEFERTYLQQQLGSLLRIDRNEDMEQQRNVIELNERIRSLQQAHDDVLSSLRHEYEVVLSEKRSLEQTILSMRSMSNEGRVSRSITKKALLLFQAGVSILTNNTSTSGFNLDTSESDTETTLSSRIDSTRTIAALSSIQGSMVNEVEYNAGAVMKRGRKRTHMDPVSDGSDKSNKSPRL